MIMFTHGYLNRDSKGLKKLIPHYCFPVKHVESIVKISQVLISGHGLIGLVLRGCGVGVSWVWRGCGMLLCRAGF